MAKTKARGWTLLVLSDSGANHRQFRISRGLVISSVIVIGLIVTFATAEFVLIWSLSDRAAQVVPLQQRIVELEESQSRLEALGSQVANLRGFEQQLRRALLSTGTDSISSLPWDPAESKSFDADIPPREAAEPSASESWRQLVRQADMSFSHGDLPTYPPLRGYLTREFTHSGPYQFITHPGLDIAARVGTPVLASANGLITFAGWSYPYGKLLVISHRSGYMTFYGHNQTLLVRTGDRVLQGQPVALLGNSGHSTAPHLHFEIWEEGAPVDPLTMLQ